MAEIGLFGGTFDPIHNGHLTTARFVRHEFELNRIIFIPAGIPPNKSNKLISDGHMRLSMINMAIQNEENIFAVTDYEIRKEGLSFTINTIDYFQKIMPNDTFYLLMGSDNLQQFQTWKNWQDILKKVKIIVFRKEEDFITIPEELKKFNHRILLSKSPRYDISSTEIRKRMSEKQNVDLHINGSVLNFIKSNNLY